VAELTAVVDDVRVKKLSDDRQLYVIKSDGKEFTTFKRDLAASAKAMIGQQAKIDYTEKQNGEWTNRYLENVESAVEFKQATAPAREIDIRRAVALKAAIEMLPYFPSEAQHWNTVKEICPGIYEFLYGQDGNWNQDDSSNGMAEADSIPF